MKRAPILFLAGLLVLAACDQKGNASLAQKNFLMRLKRAQDTISIFSGQPEIKTRIITNMSKYVRDTALTLKGWNFKVTAIKGPEIDLQSPEIGDTTASNVKFTMLVPQSDAKLKDEAAKLKVGDKIMVDGEMAMKTDDGKISMSSYFTSDSAKVIKFVPTGIK